MFKLAGSFIIGSLIEQGIASDELRKHLFLRTYGDDFDKDVRNRIVARLQSKGMRSTEPQPDTIQPFRGHGGKSDQKR